MTAIETITSQLWSIALKWKLVDFGILHLSVFGSYARWEATSKSDLDILVDLSYEKGITLSVLDEIETLLKKELSVPKVDIVTLRSLSSRLKPYIEKDLITIF